MADARENGIVQIKKYPNRRFYDATHSRHITLGQVFDMVVNGQYVVITDTRNGEDITNLVLLQLLLEKDQPKLDVLPSIMVHQLIRANRQVIRATLERFFGPFLDMLTQTRRGFDSYMRDALQGKLVTPVDWAGAMMRAFNPAEASTQPLGEEPPPDPGSQTPGEEPESETLVDLKAQVQALTRKIEELSQTPKRGQ